MNQQGLRTLSQNVRQLQEEISALNQPSPTSEIQNIRQRSIAKKINGLNDQFLENIPDGELPWMTIIIMCVEFVEEKAWRYAQLLDVAENGALKEELALILLKSALPKKCDELELDIGDTKQIIQTICLASKRFYQINNKTIQETKPAELPIIKYEPKRDTKLRRFLRRTQSKHNDPNNVRVVPGI